jgi:hypothetical protein
MSFELPPALRQFHSEGFNEFHNCRGSAVYFFCHGDEVIYVGKTKNLLNRFMAHVRNGLEFDRFLYLSLGEGITKENVSEIEDAFISALQPILNVKKRPLSSAAANILHHFKPPITDGRRSRVPGVTP